MADWLSTEKFPPLKNSQHLTYVIRSEKRVIILRRHDFKGTMECGFGIRCGISAI